MSETHSGEEELETAELETAELETADADQVSETSTGDGAARDPLPQCARLDALQACTVELLRRFDESKRNMDMYYHAFLELETVVNQLAENQNRLTEFVQSVPGAGPPAGAGPSGAPASGARASGPPGGLRETFDQVHFDGATCAGSFATWYWAPAEAAAGAPEGPEPAQSRGGALEALAEHGEERAAVASRFLASMRAVRGVRIDAVQRVRNNDLRAIFELQRRALQRKVTAPPRSLPWNPRTMEAWAFHAPGRSRAPPGAARAAPWESIVEEGFQATLAGSDNGRVFGAGVYFAHDALLSPRYALQSAKAVGPSGAPDPGPLRMFLSRIVTGISTGARVRLLDGTTRKEGSSSWRPAPAPAPAPALAL